jgi:hypothetical protein
MLIFKGCRIILTDSYKTLKKKANFRTSVDVVRLLILKIYPIGTRWKIGLKTIFFIC